MRVKGWLLDTHALLWMLHGDKRLSKRASDEIDGALPLFYSSVSFWEVAIKLSTKGFDFEVDSDWDEVFAKELDRIGVALLNPSISDCRVLQDLPAHHRDPFDRMLVCQAMRRGLGMLSTDEALDAYGVTRVW